MVHCPDGECYVQTRDHDAFSLEEHESCKDRHGRQLNAIYVGAALRFAPVTEQLCDWYPATGGGQARIFYFGSARCHAPCGKSGVKRQP